MPLKVWGYHGTLKDRAEQILQTGFQVSNNPWEWLGDGVYFWQDAPERARLWAKDWATRGSSRKDIAILKARIRLDGCMDLLDTAWSDTIRRHASQFQQKLRAGGRELCNRNNGRHELDAAFFNYICQALAEQNMRVCCIRTAITEGEPILPGSPVCYRSHVQIAIRDLDLIEELHLE